MQLQTARIFQFYRNRNDVLSEHLGYIGINFPFFLKQKGDSISLSLITA
jgi:hypothetical protein